MTSSTTNGVSIMHNHQYNYTPTPQESKIEGIIIAIACVAVFAFIGVLLAWRG